MKLIPVLFSTDMVQAERVGRKKMTRRIKGLDIINENPDDYKFHGWIPNDKGCLIARFECVFDDIDIKCPYGQPGDVLWVRETFCEWGGVNEGYAYKADGFVKRYGGWERDTPYGIQDVERVEKWKPSLFMPFKACRTFLKIISIRVEHLHDITEQECKAEGVELLLPQHLYKNYNGNTEPKRGFSRASSSFETLWRKINGGESWNRNPWVWVISFERIKIITDVN
ncbi:MAG: hypothetical protein M9904_02225 [Chitinophagaceae bacterium]|nr:hypothetical protein [Chitinophagaceae bacterium]